MREAGTYDKVKFAHNEGVRVFIKVFWVTERVKLLHLIDKTVRIAQVKIFFKQMLAFKVFRIITPF